MHLLAATNFVFVLLFTPAFSCIGHEVIVNHIRNCNKVSLIKPIRLNATLDDNCFLSSKGCLSIEGYNTAKLKYTIKKPPMPDMEREVDLCKPGANDPPELAAFLTVINIPRNCPVKTMKSCASKKKLNLEKIKPKLPFLTGPVSLRMNIDHGAKTSCIDVNFTIRKK